MGIRRVIASDEFLLQVLRTGNEVHARVRAGLPADAQIVAVGAAWDANEHATQVWLDIESDDFTATEHPTAIDVVIDRI